MLKGWRCFLVPTGLIILFFHLIYIFQSSGADSVLKETNGAGGANHIKLSIPTIPIMAPQDASSTPINYFILEADEIRIYISDFVVVDNDYNATAPPDHQGFSPYYESEYFPLRSDQLYAVITHYNDEMDPEVDIDPKLPQEAGQPPDIIGPSRPDGVGRIEPDNTLLVSVTFPPPLLKSSSPKLSINYLPEVVAARAEGNWTLHMVFRKAGSPSSTSNCRFNPTFHPSAQHCYQPFTRDAMWLEMPSSFPTDPLLAKTGKDSAPYEQPHGKMEYRAPQPFEYLRDFNKSVLEMGGAWIARSAGAFKCSASRVPLYAGKCRGECSSEAKHLSSAGPEYRGYDYAGEGHYMEWELSSRVLIEFKQLRVMPYGQEGDQFPAAIFLDKCSADRLLARFDPLYDRATNAGYRAWLWFFSNRFIFGVCMLATAVCVAMLLRSRCQRKCNKNADWAVGQRNPAYEDVDMDDWFDDVDLLVVVGGKRGRRNPPRGEDEVGDIQGQINRKRKEWMKVPPLGGVDSGKEILDRSSP